MKSPRVSAHAHKFEPIGPAIFLEEPLLAISEATFDATFAFGRIRAVEVWDMLITDVSKPLITSAH